MHTYDVASCLLSEPSLQRDKIGENFYFHITVGWNLKVRKSAKKLNARAWCWKKISVSFHDFLTIYLGIEKYVCMALLYFISSAEPQCPKKRRKVQQIIIHICYNELHDYTLQTSRAKTDIFLEKTMFTFLGQLLHLKKN